MIFNTLVYFLLFLLPAAYLFRKAPLGIRPWIIAFSGSAFFIYFSLTTVGGKAGALCLLLILWQSVCTVLLCRQGSRLCRLVVAQAILILFLFKYLNFAGALVFGAPEHSPFYWRDAFLPLGISFFTFEFIHYAVDCMKGKLKPASFRDFLAFILFFPTMVAGPIKRYQDFEPKMLAPSCDWPLDFNRGITRILVGLVKKFAVADLLTSVTDHLNRQDIALASGRGVLLLWLLAYGIKIYFDFSAYSDIAIGSARLFGIKVPENFDWPYFRTNISEFWRHWHMSLYFWLIDYIFIPLGGSRVRPVLVYRNLFIVMLASGLWHGAALHFVAWGLWHAVLLSVHRLWSSQRGLPVGRWYTVLSSWALTFTTVNFGWLFFAMDFPTATAFLQRLAHG